MKAGAFAGCAGAFVLVGCMGIVGLAVLDEEDQQSTGGSCISSEPITVDLKSLPKVEGFTPEQVKNAAVIAKTASDLKLGKNAQLVGIMTAQQESQLGLATHATGVGDAGMFQQRTLKGWYGSMKQIMNPAYSAKAFFKGVTADSPGDYGSAGGGSGYGHIPGLVDIPGWEHMEPTKAAQLVQRSDYPDAYAQHEKSSRALLAAIGSADVDLDTNSSASDAGGSEDSCGTDAAPKASGSAKEAIKRAKTLIGTTYVFGAGDKNGTTNGGVDCSGLMMYAYGLDPGDIGRTAQDQWYSLAAHKIDEKKIAPGDLIFYAYGRTGPMGDPNSVSHVGMYIGDGQMIEASSSRHKVRISAARLGDDAAFIGVGRIPNSDKGQKP